MSEDNNFSCRNSTTGNVSLALKQLNHCLIKRLQDGQSSTPAGVLTRYLRILSKNFESGLSAFLRKLRRFRRSEPPIITGFSASSTLNFKWLTLLLPRFGPRAFSLKRAAYCSRLFESVNNLFDELDVLLEVVAASSIENRGLAKIGKPRCLSNGVFG